jgi:hypothetical protein
MKKLNIINLTIYISVLSCINYLVFSIVTYAPSAQEYGKTLIQVATVVSIVFWVLTIVLLVLNKIKPEFIRKVPKAVTVIYLLIAILATLFTLATGVA